jgi:hypothetical protein
MSKQDRDARYYNNHRTEILEKKQHQYWLLRTDGLCVKPGCGKPVDREGAYCNSCLKERSERS